MPVLFPRYNQIFINVNKIQYLRLLSAFQIHSPETKAFLSRPRLVPTR